MQGLLFGCGVGWGGVCWEEGFMQGMLDRLFFRGVRRSI